jgi:SAM-dependent methyltransferase
MTGFHLEVSPVRLSPALPWDYKARARQLLADARSVLDMGTGGGEVFSGILQGSSVRATATESWPPNVLIAALRLRPLGAQVVQADSLRLPFASGAFDLVLNRHEELDPAETARVLAPGGALLTQQVRPDNWRELNDFFPRRTAFPPHFELYQQGFRVAGLAVQRVETHKTMVAYPGLGDIVYLLTALPWEVPAFDVVRDIDALLALDKALRGPQGIVLTESHYMIEAHKPG